jgi:hypothetical protein
MALIAFDPNPNPFHPVRTTNSKDVFTPDPLRGPGEAPPPDEPDETDETDGLAQLRALLTARQRDAK